MSDYSQPLSDFTCDSVVEWRIRQYLEGGTYCLPVMADGRVDEQDVLEAIAIEIDDSYLSMCDIEYRPMDSDEPWTQLSDTTNTRSSAAVMAAETAIELLEARQASGLLLTSEQMARLAALLPGVSEK